MVFPTNYRLANDPAADPNFGRDDDSKAGMRPVNHDEHQDSEL